MTSIHDWDHRGRSEAIRDRRRHDAEDEQQEKDAEEADTPIREAAVKKRSEPLKGGRDKGSGGEQFGLNW